MKRIALVLVAVAALAGMVAYMSPATGQADGEAAPIYGIKIPPGYRDWRLISVNHLAGGPLKQVRAQLGNDIAIQAFRAGKLPSVLFRLQELMCFQSKISPQCRITDAVRRKSAASKDLVGQALLPVPDSSGIVT